MTVNGKVIVENKAVQNISVAHEVQLVNYLTTTGIDVGLLLNFGSERLQVKRKTRTLPLQKLGVDSWTGLT